MDITGITLPVTKHNYLVTRATDIPGVVREAFHVARSGRPGPVLIDITKDAQQTSVEVPAPREPRRSRLPAAGAGEAELDRAAAFVETAAEVIGLREIDFRVIGSGRTGPVTRTLQTAYHSLVRGEHPLSAQWLTPVPAVAVAAVG